MKILIWGVGTRGKRVFSRFRKEEVIAFIESDEDKIGNMYQEKPIISLEEYLKQYKEYFILISPIKNEEIRRKLDESGIWWYFVLSDCPAEFYSVTRCVYLDEMLKKYNTGERYAIYGMNFYSIYLIERFKEDGCNKVYLLPEINRNEELLKKIEESFDFVKVIFANNLKERVDRIYVASAGNDLVNILQEELGFEGPIDDVFDLTENIVEYENQKLAQFKDVNYGESCFIIATGPSVRIEDLEKIQKRGIKTISMNRAYRAFDNTVWRPDYYMISDRICIQESVEEIKSMPVDNVFISDQYPEFWLEKVPENIYKYHLQFSTVPLYSKEIIYAIYGGATVTYECMQLATYLGFKKIFLLGVDFNFSSSYTDKGNHFISNYYDKTSQAFGFLEEESLRAYRAAKRYANAHGIKIYNATRGGKLEVFERVDFDSLFEEQ